MHQSWRSTGSRSTPSSCTPPSSSDRSRRWPVWRTPCRSGAPRRASRWWSPSRSPWWRSGSPTSPATPLVENNEFFRTGPQAELVETHESRAGILRWSVTAFALVTFVAAWLHSQPSRAQAASAAAGVVAGLAVLTAVYTVLTGDAGAQIAWSGIKAERPSTPAPTARQQPPERRHPLGLGPAGGDGLVEAALGLVGAVRAAARAALGQLLEVGERLDQVLRLHVREPERADARGVDDPAVVVGQREQVGRGGGVPAAPGDRVDDPDLAHRVGHQRVDQRRLADPAGAQQHADLAGQPLEQRRRGRRRGG